MKTSGENLTPLPPPRWSLYAPIIPLAALCFLIYSSTLNAGFVWDDHKLIIANVHQAQGPSLLKLWVSDYWQSERSEYYRPLTTTTFLLDFKLHGDRPGGYHLTNLILYAGLCALVYLLYLRLLKSVPLAFAAAALFAALPAHTENTAWVSGRTDIISAAAMLGSLLFYLKSEESQRTRRLALAAALFALSLFGKEASIVMAGIVALREFLQHGLTRRTIITTAPFAAVALVFILIHFLAAPHVQDENIYTTPAAYAANALRNLGLYVWHSFIPGGYEYIITATRDEAARCFQLPSAGKFILILIPLIAALAGLGIALRRREKLLALALAAGLMAIIPVSGIIPIGVIFALRFLLIPSIFFILFLALILDRIARTWPEGKIVFPLALAALALVYAVLSFVAAARWKDDARLMAWVAEREPNAAMAHLLLGNGLSERGKGAEAIRAFEAALKVRPDYPEAEYNLGVLLERQGKTDDAEKHYRRVVASSPGFLPAREALINLLVRSGRSDEAEQLKRELPHSP